MNQLEIIRAEIERRIKKYATDVTMPLEVLGKVILELKGILSFLDTLESEKPMNQDGLEEEIERCVIEPYYDLDGVAVKGATGYITVNDVADLARHFAEWGAEHARDQMMKEAVETELYWDGDFLAIDLNMAELGYSERDKVRIIIVKEN